MKRKYQSLGFTIVELLVVISIIALLVGILVPAVQKARDSAKVTQAKSNIHQVMIALQTYASDHNDRNFTTAPDNLSGGGPFATGGRTGAPIRTAIGQLSADAGYPMGIRLGEYGNDDNGYIYFIGIDTWYGGENGGIAPYCFQSGLTTSAEKPGYGVWRYPNALQVAEYMEGKTLHDAYFSPKDEVPLRAIEDCDGVQGSYCLTTEMQQAIGSGDAVVKSNMLAIPSSFTISPPMMYHPAVYQWNLFAGQFPTDPMNIPRGFKPPSLSQTRYPAHKTWLMEHHWLQNVSGSECSRLLGNPINDIWFIDGDGAYDGCAPSLFNAHPDSEPVTVFADGTVGTYSINDYIVDSALLGNNALWLTTANMQQYGFDDGDHEGYFADMNEISNTTCNVHTHTKYGSSGRDKVAK